MNKGGGGKIRDRKRRAHGTGSSLYWREKGREEGKSIECSPGDAGKVKQD